MVERLDLPLIRDVESRIGLGHGFFERLISEDDWSFVIKLHAFFEAACTQTLIRHFREPKLLDVISRLELSGRATGKVAFLGALGLMGKESRRYVSSLSELRNDLVHDVRNVDFTLAEHVQRMDARALRLWAVAFSPYETFVREMPSIIKHPPDHDPAKHSIEAMVKRARESTKIHVWIGALNTLLMLLDLQGLSAMRQLEKAREVEREYDERDAAKEERTPSPAAAISPREPIDSAGEGDEDQD